MSLRSWLFGRRREGGGDTAHAIARLIRELGFELLNGPWRCRPSWNQRSRGAWSWTADVKTPTGYEVTLGSQSSMTRVLRAHRRGKLEVNREDGAVHLDIEEGSV